ncbi:MAG: type 4a pilus biogenesis protein PilO [Nitrospirae bacterium]|nr:type 4a pilus biogenesis protein PilO [Candidatus Manganitrophaceae bacterium]
MALNLERLKNLTNTQKFVSLVLIIVIASGAFVWFVFIPKSAEIAAFNSDIAELNNEINVHRTKVKRLDELVSENRELKHQLTQLKEQLPPEAEVEILLKQVSELGARTGLDFKLWRPAQRKPNASGLYVEIPVDVEVAGGYHALGVFFDKISKLPRIVNVSNIRMGSSKPDQHRVSIQTSFSATAFAVVEGGAAAPPPPVSEKGKTP